MTLHLFPDNTVLCNYACVDRIDLLEDLLSGNGRWTQAVEYEASRSSDIWPDMNKLFEKQILGESIEIQDAEMVQKIRIARLGGDSKKPLQHLGEAETVYLIQNSSDFKGAIWITDDADAFEFGQQQGIVTWDTVTTLQMIVANGDLSAENAHSLLVAMKQRGRNFRRFLTSPRDFA